MNNFNEVKHTQFTNKQNLQLLWDVLLDELKINNSNKSLINNIRTVFESNINPFTSRANHKLNVMELNKQFLSQIVLAVNKLFPNITSFSESTPKHDQNIKRITIFPEDAISEPYKIEDIHASRQSNFDKELEQKRIEMENYMIPQKPKELDFSDRNLDGKITEMDSLIADKLAQRNLEFDNLQTNNYNSSNIDPEKWLTPKETSIKQEKIGFLDKSFTNKPIIKNNQNNQNNRLKHISIDNNNNITLSIDEIDQKLKKVSWNDLEDKSQELTTEPIINIFNKLKKQPIIQSNQDDIINLNDDKHYVEQKSMPLPNIKQEDIIRNQSTLIQSNNEPVLPKTEIIKQLNEMNKKIDDLYEIILKLISVSDIKQTININDN